MQFRVFIVLSNFNNLESGQSNKAKQDFKARPHTGSSHTCEAKANLKFIKGNPKSRSRHSPRSKYTEQPAKSRYPDRARQMEVQRQMGFNTVNQRESK